jgi:hypothetical protein
MGCKAQNSSIVFTCPIWCAEQRCSQSQCLLSGQYPERHKRRGAQSLFNGLVTKICTASVRKRLQGGFGKWPEFNQARCRARIERREPVVVNIRHNKRLSPVNHRGGIKADFQGPLIHSLLKMHSNYQLCRSIGTDCEPVPKKRTQQLMLNPY